MLWALHVANAELPHRSLLQARAHISCLLITNFCELWGQLLAEYNKSHIVVLQYLRKQLETVILKSRWPSFS